MQQQIRQLVTTDFSEFYPKVVIGYATGRRPTSDVEGAGPGLFIATAVIKALIGSEIPCFFWPDDTCRDELEGIFSLS